MWLANLRERLNRNSALVTVLVVALLLVSLGFFVLQGRQPVYQPPAQAYFYDLSSNQANPMDRLFLAKATDVPPISAPSGTTMPDGTPTGVRANLFACGDCAKGKLFIGYLDLLTKDAKDAQIQAQSASAATTPTPLDPQLVGRWEAGHLIRTVEEDHWVPIKSPQGEEILNALEEHCKGTGKAPRPCYPTRP